MATIANAFERCLSGLELTESERKNASRQQNHLRAQVRDRLPAERDIISGSYARKTAIRPLNDIDLFFILDGSSDDGKKLRQSPQACLKAVIDAVDDAYPTKEKPKGQTRSVNISFTGTGIGYDVIPAFAVGGGDYEIPDVRANAWIRTNPEIHMAVSTEANETAGKKLKPLIKAAKRWNYSQGKVVRSFHLETMAYGAFVNAPSSYAAGLQILFERLASAVLMACREPAGLGPDLDSDMTPAARRAASAAFKDASATAKKALWCEGDGYVEEAHFLWRSLLGDAYPERGVQPSQELLKKLQGLGAAGGTTGVVDPGSRRFG